jgi:hypothetical protein
VLVVAGVEQDITELEVLLLMAAGLEGQMQTVLLELLTQVAAVVVLEAETGLLDLAAQAALVS